MSCVLRKASKHLTQSKSVLDCDRYLEHISELEITIPN